MVAMARPVVVVVDAEDASRQALTRELEGRYGADYRIVSSASPQEALAGLEQLRGEGAEVPLVLTDQWMPAEGRCHRVRLRLMCDTVASLDARHSRNASGVERGRAEVPSHP
jgi:CheY-like chemotaxis protein